MDRQEVGGGLREGDHQLKGTSTIKDARNHHAGEVGNASANANSDAARGSVDTL
jgi:hypothetical protein